MWGPRVGLIYVCIFPKQSLLYVVLAYERVSDRQPASGAVFSKKMCFRQGFYRHRRKHVAVAVVGRSVASQDSSHTNIVWANVRSECHQTNVQLMKPLLSSLGWIGCFESCLRGLRSGFGGARRVSGRLRCQDRKQRLRSKDSGEDCIVKTVQERLRSNGYKRKNA